MSPFLFARPLDFYLFESVLWILILGIPVFLVWIKKFSDSKIFKKYFSIFAIFGTIIWGCIFYGSFIESRQLRLNQHQIAIPNLAKMKIAVVSDLHVGPYKKADFVEKIVDEINRISDLDAVFLPGDFVFGSAEKYSENLEPLKNIQIAEKWAVLGNHDHWKFAEFDQIQSGRVEKKLEKMGIKVLKNESDFWEKKGVFVLGVDDNSWNAFVPTVRFHDTEKTFAGVPDPAPKILLAHSPDIWWQMEKKFKPDLILSGHSHCGQIRFPLFGAIGFLVPIRDRGLEKGFWPATDLRPPIFVTCGTGEVGPRGRFLNPPEISILQIN